MPGTAGPRHGFVWGYSPGETTWGVGAFNPNFAKLEALLHLTVTSITSTPPVTPASGMVYIVGGSPTGDWVGHTGAVAAYYTTGWLFIVPATGVRAWNIATSTYWRYSGSAWVEEPASGNVSGPGSAVTGAVPVYADATGKVLADSGVGFDQLLQIAAPLVVNNLLTVDPVGRAIDSGIHVGGLGTGDVTGPATSVAGHLPSYSDGTGKFLADSGIPAADVILAGGTLVPGNILTVDVGGDLVDTGVPVTDVGAGGDVVGPATATAGHLASYADGTGELLADSAIPAAAVAQTGGALSTGHLLAADAAGKVVDSGLTTAAVAASTLPAGSAQYDQLVWNGSAWAPQRPRYVFGFNVPGVLAVGTVFSHVFTKAVTIPANFGSYLGHATQVRGSANATSSPVVTVARATAASPLSFSNVGTITITAGGVVPVLATSGSAVINFAAGDIARFLVTTGDTTFADLTATVVGMET